MMKRRQIVTGRLGNNRGFTLIEIIAVLIIIAIISAVVISRGTATEEAKLRAEVDTLKAHLRYAQYLAMDDLPGTQWGISIGGSSYTLVKVDTSGTTNPYNLPGESSATHSFASGVTAVTTGSNPILFDEWGSPGTTSSSITIGGQSITITATTGFIP